MLYLGTANTGQTIIVGLFHKDFFQIKINEMSLSGLFFQGTCWLHIPVYFLHFRRRPFNLLFFSMKVLKLFSEKTLWKWKLLYLVENQTRKINFLITKILRKIYYTYFFEMTVCLNFHKKDSGTHSFRFFERRLLQSSQFS